jgi:hypothetical protein
VFNRVRSFLSAVFRGVWFFCRTGLTERQITALYFKLARLDYREWKTFQLRDGTRFSIRTMVGGPRIILPSTGYEFILGYLRDPKQVYIQEAGKQFEDGWRKVYRSQKTFIKGEWLRVVKELLKHNPCVESEETGR